MSTTQPEALRENYTAADMATAAAQGYRDGTVEIDALKGQRRVLCDLLRECLPVIDAQMQYPGTDESDARLNDLAGGIAGALMAVEKERAQEVLA